LKEQLKERLKLDRRRLEEGVLLYWILKRIQEYDLQKLEDIAIPSELDEVISTICPMFHHAFIKKWICKLIVEEYIIKGLRWEQVLSLLSIH